MGGLAGGATNDQQRAGSKGGNPYQSQPPDSFTTLRAAPSTSHGVNAGFGVGSSVAGNCALQPGVPHATYQFVFRVE